MEKERKLQIIKAADKRFSKHGLGKTTLDEIARDLRIGKATIYHYFISKEELFFETINWEVSQIIEDIKAIFSGEQKDLKEKVSEYFSFKEGIINKYKLVYEITLLLLKEETYEKESEIISNLFRQEEELINQALKTAKNDIPEGLPLLLVRETWGGLLWQKLVHVTGKDSSSSGRDLTLQIITRLL